MQPYDIAMLAILLLMVVFGAWKGMAWQLASLGSIVISCLVAANFSGMLAPYFGDNEPWNRFIAMLVLYLVTSFAIWMLFRLVAGVIDRVRLKEFDRQLGAIFGLLKGVLLCVVITFFAVTLSEKARQTVLRSRSGYYIAYLTEHATPILPEEVRRVIGKYLDELDRKLDPETPPEDSGGSGSFDTEPGTGDRVPEEVKKLSKGVDDIKRGVETLREGFKDISRGRGDEGELK